MADFSDKEDRMLIQLVHNHGVVKGKRISWSKIAAQMKTKKTNEQLRLRVVCLKKRFGNILANFPRRYFFTGESKCRIQSEVPQKNKKMKKTAPKDSGREREVDQRAQEEGFERASILDLFSNDEDTDDDLLLCNDREKSFLTAPTRKKLRRRTKPQASRNSIGTSTTTMKILSAVNSVAESNTAELTFSMLLTKFNTLVDAGSPVMLEKETAVSNGLQHMPHGIESRVTMRARSVGQTAVARLKKVSQAL